MCSNVKQEMFITKNGFCQKTPLRYLRLAILKQFIVLP